MKLKGRRALVTGGAQGIGRAVAQALSSEGCDVVVNYRSSSREALELQDNIRESGCRALAVQADISQPDESKRLCQEGIAYLGGIDILVNCAGMMQQCSLEELKPEEWNKVIAVNLTSVYLMSHYCVEALKQSGRGRIINISSQAAFTGSRNRCAYSASKSGLLGLTYTLAKELGPFGITVNALSPGRIVTDMIQGDMEKRAEEWLLATPLGRFGDVGEIASVVTFLASDEASYITGANVNVNGGILMG